MTRKRYEHSSYWYARNCGWTRSDKASCAERYIEHVGAKAGLGGCDGYDPWPAFNPLLLACCVAADIGVAVRRAVGTLSDPAERDRIRRELVRDLRAVRRPFYYARETERRRRLAAERRKVGRRRTSAPMPTPEDLLDAWNRRKESKGRMILLGGMLQDLECYVDNCLRFDGDGRVVGRNRGIRGWLKEFLPELSPKYKTLMRYKAMAIRLRQATGTEDPTPTSALLAEPIPEAVREILEDFRMTFSSLEESLARRLDPAAVFLDGKPNGAAALRPKAGVKCGHGRMGNVTKSGQGSMARPRAKARSRKNSSRASP